MRGALRGAAAVFVVLAAGACGFSEVLAKREGADRVSDAFDRAAKAGVVMGTLGLSATIDKLRSPIQGVKAGFTSLTLRLPVSIDVGRARAAVSLPDGSAGRPWQAFDGAVVYQHDPNSAPSRPWVGLDLSRIYGDREAHKGDAFGSNLLNPAHLFSLLPGVLTGSLRDLGVDTVAGVSTRHYRANFDASKALRDAPRSRREAILTAFALMGAPYDAIPGEVWLDGDGVARQVRFRLKEKLSRRDIVSLNLIVTINEFGPNAPVAIPAKAESTRSSDLGAVSRGLLGLLAEFAAPGSGGSPR